MVKAKSHAEYVNEVFILVGNEYVVLGEYIGSHKKILLQHKKCGNKYEVDPTSFLRGTRCAFCSGRRKRNTKDYQKVIFELVGDEYLLVGEYKNSSTHVKLKHSKCNNTYNVLPSNFYKGTRCPYCYGNKKKTTSLFKSEVFNIVDNEYSVVGEYVNTDTKIEMKHNLCSTEYSVKPYHFLQGIRCPRCANSKGEKEVERVLTSLNLKFKPQYTFEDCKSIRLLKFDFAIFKDSKLKFLIEYDGEHHFMPVDYAGQGKEFAKEKFEITQQNDSIKNNHCDFYSIPLLRIPYWDFENIENIINEFTKKYN